MGNNPPFRACSQPPQSFEFAGVRPEDPRSVRCRLTRVDPAVRRPTAKLAFGHLEFACQIREPPLIGTKLLFGRRLTIEAAADHELADKVGVVVTP